VRVAPFNSAEDTRDLVHEVKDSRPGDDRQRRRTPLSQAVTPPRKSCNGVLSPRL
jgi:hypothetical protein